MKITTTVLALLATAPIWAQQVQRPPLTTPRPHPEIAAPARPGTGLNLSNGSVRGGEGGGTRGGGETVDFNGRPELRDLVEQSVCEWRGGDDVVAATPHVRTVLRNISRLNWYFALALESEIRNLNYCITGALVRVRTEDEDGLTAVVTEGTRQVAIRLMDEVYIDDTIFQRMSARSQAYLIVHEAMHSFLSWGEEQRNQKLRSIVRAVEGIEAGRISTRSSLALQMERNGVDFPADVSELDAYQRQVTFMLGDFATRTQALVASNNPVRFFATMSSLNSNLLWTPHRELLKQASLESFVEEVIFNDSTEVLELLARPSNIRTTVLTQATLSANSELNPHVVAWLEREAPVDQLVDLILADLKERAVVDNGSQLVVRGQELLSLGGTENTSVTSLVAINNAAWAQVSPELRTYAQLIAKLLREEDQSSVERITVNHPAFYAAFGVTEIKAAIDRTRFTAQEKDLAKRNVTVMAVAFWNLVQDVALRDVPRVRWQEVKNQINFNQLGYRF